MISELIKIPVGLDQEEVAKVFVTTELVALPVVDEWDHIKGIVTFDDIASVIQEEATEDIQKIGATESLDAPDMKTPFAELIRKRAPWLAVLFLGQTLTTSFMSSGGNSGSMLPFALKRMSLDPATASAPFVATIVDVTGILIYFTVAGLILTGVIL